MPNYYHEMHPDLPVLLLVGTENYDVSEEVADAVTAAYEVLDELSDPVYVIFDVTRVPRFDLDDMIIGAKEVALRGGDKSLLKHPNIQNLIYVTSDKMLKLAVKGLDSPIFGSIKVITFTTLDEALDYIREDIASQP